MQSGWSWPTAGRLRAAYHPLSEQNRSQKPCAKRRVRVALKQPAGLAGTEVVMKIGVLGLIFDVFELIIEPITFFDEKEVD
ncbi:MAG TPA: hypothetical protein VMW24_28335 [Sedimentisphaerales bacterium]|nr:hypothetical protein [Sedimentisphaerales bacterium]